jgi:hypothetical protein
LLVAGLAAGGSGLASAATTPSGTAIAVIQSSEAEGAGGRRPLATEGPVFSGDRILTGNIGEAQLRFRDGTRLVVGPNSSMVLDAFIFNDDDTARTVAINVVRGAFRFITGNGPKDAYAITTPTATISVRGTAFDLDVDPLGTTRLAVVEGGVISCDRLPPPRQTCVFQVADCEVIVTERGQLPRIATREERRRELLTYFPYLRSQARLVADFRLDVDGCGAVPGGLSPPITVRETEITAVLSAPPSPPGPPGPPPPPPPRDDPPPPSDDGKCPGNCGNGQGNGGGNGTGNEGNGNGPPEGHGGGNGNEGNGNGPPEGHGGGKKDKD